MATTKVQSELIVDDVALAGNPTTSTQSAGNNTTRIATTAFVTTAVDNLIASAPGTMDTLNEIAAALGDDPSFTTTVNNAIATKLNLSGGTLTGDVTFNGTNLYFNGAASSAGHNLALENSDTFTSFYGSTSSSIDKGYKFFVGNQGADLAFTINADKSIATAGAVMIGGTLHDEWHSDYIGLEIGHSGFIYNRTAGNELFASSNAYYDSGWKFAKSGRASMLDLQAGRIRARTSNATGSQDGAITWVTALDVAADNGNTTFAGAVSVGGNLDIAIASNTPYIRGGQG